MWGDPTPPYCIIGLSSLFRFSLVAVNGWGSISFRKSPPLKPLTATILPVLRLCRQREADESSASRWRFAIIRAEPLSLENIYRYANMQGVPPCTPHRSKKLMWLRPQSIGSGNTVKGLKVEIFSVRKNTTCTLTV